MEGFLVFFRRRTTTGRWCLSCALAEFREHQFTCLTRGWWGPLSLVFTAVALLANLRQWRRLRDLGEPTGTSAGYLLSSPVRRQPLAWAAPMAFMGVVAVVLLAPWTGSARSPRPDYVSSVDQFPFDGTTPEPSPSPSPSPQPPVEPVHRAHQAWVTMLMKPPSHWTYAGHDLSLSLSALSRQFKSPKPIAAQLAVSGYLRGVDREFYRSSPRDVVDVELWQFASPKGAGAFFDTVWLGNGSPAASKTIHPFDVHLAKDAFGYISSVRDEYGFHFGVAFARIGDVVVHIRCATLAPMTRSELLGFMKQELVRVRMTASGSAAGAGSVGGSGIAA